MCTFNDESRLYIPKDYVSKYGLDMDLILLIVELCLTIPYMICVLSDFKQYGFDI